MARKRDDSKPRGRGKRTDIMNAIRRGERALFIRGSQLLLLFVFLVFTAVSAANSAPLLAAVGGIGVFLLARVLFPLERISDFFEWIACGGAGEWLHNAYLRVMPGRSPDDRRRGQTTTRSLLALALVVLIASSLVVSGVTVADDESTAVTHDEYLDDAMIAEFESTSSVESTDRNVRTEIEQTEAFVRLHAENPNSYPVDMTVKVHPDIVPAAELGEVSAADNDTVSTWRNTHDFDTDQSYTEITFTADANSELTFAPSKARVLAIAWKDSATSGDGLLDRIPNPLSDDDLEQRTYDLNSSSGSSVTVPLENADGQSVDEWHASYRTGPDDNWKPISTDSDDPAFYQTIDGEAVQFHFDTDNYGAGDVEVEFTANPSFRDKATHEYRSFTAGWSDILSFDLLSVSSPTTLVEVVR